MNNLFKKAQEGFSLVEITIAMGMLGILTTVIIGLNKQQIELEKRTETSSDIAFFHRRILKEFNSKESCEATLGGIGSIQTDPMVITSIRKDDGTVFYSVDYEFGKDVSPTEKYYKIDSMTVDFDIAKFQSDGSVLANRIGPAKLIIVYKIHDGVTNIIGSRQRPKTIALGDVQVTESTTGVHTLRGCVGNSPTPPAPPAPPATLGTTAKEACDISTGILDTSITEINKCRLSHFFDYSIMPRGGTQRICSRDPADASYCVTAWGMSSNTLERERHAISADSMTSYLNRTYGEGSSPTDLPNTENLFLGRESQSTGINNTLVGHQAGNQDTKTTANSANLNTFLGYQAGRSTTTGGRNTLVGSTAGINITTGTNNIMIGEGTGPEMSGIGASFDTADDAGITRTGSWQLRIGSLLFGQMPSDNDIPTAAPKITELGGGDGLVVNGGMVVKFGIKVGNSGFACNSGNGGVIRYNSNKMEFCDGTAWKEMGGGGGGGWGW